WALLRATVLLPERELFRSFQLSVGWSGTCYRALDPPPASASLPG
ncbi:MAG: hypothetical protein HGA24_00220, partial [Candidatus Aminicenantes bacterium]|nr:hypothetical protein [Candidatus Aminicenantes bacterium]